MKILSSYLAVLALVLMIFGVPIAFAVQVQPTTHTITIQGMRFIPDSVVVAPGDTVVWMNQDNVPHTATSDDNTSFDTGVIAPGAAFSMVMTAAGTFAYHCTIHPNMTATIIVGQAPTLPQPQPQPLPSTIPPYSQSSP